MSSSVYHNCALLENGVAICWGRGGVFVTRGEWPSPQSNDNCPLRHRRANPYIVYMRRSRESPRRSREGIIPSPSIGNATKCN